MYFLNPTAVQTVFRQLVIRPFGPILYSAAAHLFTKQLLCELSYAGILTEG
jgi:hypothetical protein